MIKTLSNLSVNPRFYILASSVVMSLLIPSYLRLQIPSDQLFYIRVAQVFGYLCITLWYLALLISPLHKRLGARFGTGYLVFARRAIGVSAAYFALLHVIITFLGQMNGFQGLLLLPDRFLWALGLGSASLVILLLMAATSFDKVIAYMTYRRWKWLHRLGYIGGIFVLVHMWMIGTHLSYLTFRSAIFVMLAVLAGFESVRIAESLAKRYPKLQQKKTLISVLLWITLIGALLAVPQLIDPSANHHIGEGVK